MKPFRMCLEILTGSSTEVSWSFLFRRTRIVFDELLDSNLEPPVVLEVIYSVRRKKEVPVALLCALPSALGGRINARSAAQSGGGCAIACIAVRRVSQRSKLAWARGPLSYLIHRHRRPLEYPPGQWACRARHQLRCLAAALAQAVMRNWQMCTVHSKDQCWGCPAAWVDKAAEGAHWNI